MRKITVVIVVDICLITMVVAGFPQSSNAAEIYGCVANLGGFLRIVSAPSKCTRYETAISWNQAGLQGPAGPTGATGQAGAVGPIGSVGPIGAAGAQGLAGPVGPQGPAGTGGVDGMASVVIGKVAGDGTALSGTGFQIVKNTGDGPGIYTIIFATVFPADPICLCSTSAFGEFITSTTEKYVV
jgi:hypothetical protein